MPEPDDAKASGAENKITRAQKPQKLRKRTFSIVFKRLRSIDLFIGFVKDQLKPGVFVFELYDRKNEWVSQSEKWAEPNRD